MRTVFASFKISSTLGGSIFAGGPTQSTALNELQISNIKTHSPINITCDDLFSLLFIA